MRPFCDSATVIPVWRGGAGDVRFSEMFFMNPPKAPLKGWQFAPIPGTCPLMNRVPMIADPIAVLIAQRTP